MLTVGALQAADERGIRVPDDLSLIGFDDSFAGFLTPPLMTIAQPVQALCEDAIRPDLLDEEPACEDDNSLLFATALTVRNSTSKNRQA